MDDNDHLNQANVPDLQQGGSPHSPPDSSNDSSQSNHHFSRTITFYPSTPNSIPTLRDLFAHSFPLTYPESFYRRLETRQTYFGFNLLLSPVSSSSDVGHGPSITVRRINTSYHIDHNLLGGGDTPSEQPLLSSLIGSDDTHQYHCELPGSSPPRLEPITDDQQQAEPMEANLHHILGSVVIRESTQAFLDVAFSTLTYYLSRYWLSHAPNPTPVVYIALMAITPAYQQCGMGSLLLYCILRYIRHQFDPYYVELHVQTENTAAQKLYSRFGFSVAAHDPEYFTPLSPNERAAFLMRLDMSQWNGSYPES